MRLGVTQRLRSAAVLLLTFLAASMAFDQVDPGSKPAQRNNPGPPLTQVLVVNGTGSPVPTAPQGATNVAGTVNVGNTPNVNVANTPSVNVTNSPTVQLGNSPSSPIPTCALDEPGRIPFVAYSSNTCSGTGCDYTFPTVRAGHRVVLQHVSASLAFLAPSPTALFAAVDGGFGAIFSTRRLPPAPI
jgi:hypothetical protein